MVHLLPPLDGSIEEFWSKIFEHKVGEIVRVKETGDIAIIRTVSIGWDPQVYSLETPEGELLGWYRPREFEVIRRPKE